MAVKKSELYRALWNACDKLRGGMDASQYKDYVLTLLFVKYVSDKYAGQPHPAVVVPKGASFADMCALKGKPDIGDQINKKIIAPLQRANDIGNMPDFNDDAKFGSGRAKTDCLAALVSVFDKPELDFSDNRAEDDDLLGDAYEYLMRHFAAESGKSKGQFYTPAEVSRLMAKILLSFGNTAKVQGNTTFYDPTCGSGSLLMRIVSEAGGGSPYGQEKDFSTAALARMNMILHSMPVADIKPGNTLADPQFTKDGQLRTFDYVVANPPFSDKAWSTGVNTENDPYQRFTPCAPPPKQGDYAYLLHIVRSLKPRGKGACVLPHGVLFRGNAESRIRRKLVEDGYIRAVIGLPPNLFYGTGIPACVVFLDKENAGARKGIFFVDAAAGFVKDGPKNRLREMDIRRITDAFIHRGEVSPEYARMVGRAEIARNNYNLNIPRYIDNRPPEDAQDIDAHLRGGVPNADLDSAALAAYWEVFPGLRGRLFSPLRKGYSAPSAPPADIAAKTRAGKEFAALTKKEDAHFAKWRAAQHPKLCALKTKCRPKEIIIWLGDSIWAHYKNAPLLCRYRAYQHLMEFWEETMDDDCHMIAADGWSYPASVSLPSAEWDLVPVRLVAARYFADAQKECDALRAKADSAAARRVAVEEEHGGEGGYLHFESRKINKREVRNCLEEGAGDAEAEAMLREWIKLSDSESVSRKEAKRTEDALRAKALAHYINLSEEEIKVLVVDDKWFAEIGARLRRETEDKMHGFCARLRTLCERYETPLSALSAESADLERKVGAHLQKMGFARQ